VATAPVVATEVPSFSWLAVQGAATYQIRVDKINPTTGIAITANVINKTVLTGTSYSHTEALTAATYRFWVRAVSTGSGGATSSLSVRIDFTVNA